MAIPAPPELEEITDEYQPTGFDRWIELAVAAAVIIIALVILWEAKDFRAQRSVRISPRLFPQIVGVGELLVGIWYVVDIIRHPHSLSGGEDSEDVDVEAPTNWLTLFLLAVGLTSFAALVQRGGFPIAAAVMFTICSTAMGSRKVWLSFIIGLALGTAIFLIFNNWLGVRLPAGWLGGVL